MLRHKRPEGSAQQKTFCDKYLAPVFGTPDSHGNYILAIGDKPRIAFMAHHDTVHHDDGLQTICIEGNIASLSNASRKTSSCMGADCTTGIWLILAMIAARVPGRYVIHAGEEIGGVGALALVNDNSQTWIDETDFAISFDRFGTESIVTHQCDRRTASDKFADSLSDILGMRHAADPGGIFTDSEVYSDCVPECTNLSVGYLGHHTKDESQDLSYAADLAAALVAADWSRLVVDRDPTQRDGGYATEPWSNGFDDFGDDSRQDMIGMIEDNPDAIADLLETLGYSGRNLADYLGHQWAEFR